MTRSGRVIPGSSPTRAATVSSPAENSSRVGAAPRSGASPSRGTPASSSQARSSRTEHLDNRLTATPISRNMVSQAVPRSSAHLDTSSGSSPAPTGSPTRPRSHKTPLIAAISGVVVVIIIILLVTAFVAPGFAKTKVLNASSVQDGVQKILTDTYKVTDVSKVSCPAGQEVTNGGTFTCRATIAGKDTDVKVTITDDNGTYQVGRP